MEFNMRRIAPWLSAAVLVLHGCAAPAGQPTTQDHAAHRAAGATAAPAGAKAEPPMKMMQAMRARMREAKTPEERVALMEEHMMAMSKMCAHDAHDAAGAAPPSPK